ncbi:Acetyltransferase involved in cellulose biosynthesis, CelD/BcsL family [Phyllobacterium sp. CL33Tsu]|uniref:GNAT family N-acetyltransferase n=1 Tax=Phyllobacterium sp. CL33Tsu TaxID=1798191 RepID=UPI0008EA6FD2|nr:GNAT family N-acetyltransferase [Phyllobacterium sp. CL33Tsu]SFJ08766.1 Acetyltransferase involved in cellulose biosynthesis, CelD/BcsL family [Phyllobacterium sp. CL33Tsu]
MAPSRLVPRIVVDASEATTLWNAFAGEFLAGAAQTAQWFSCWQSSANSDCLVAALLMDGAPVLLLPLEVERRGSLRIACYVGGPHANCNFPALLPTLSITQDDLNGLFQALHRARPDIDIVTLSRQLPELAGAANPLMQLQHRTNPNISLAIRLDGSFETVLNRHNSKRKMKKHRHVVRRYDDAGGFKIVTAASAAESRNMLDDYFAWKSDRLARAGITNTYEPKGVKEFFHHLFADETNAASPRFQLRALEVKGKYRAVLGKSHAKGMTFIDFVGIADDELVSTSPGEFLFYKDIEEICGSDLAIYSFGIGDEPYKRSWSEIETPTYDNDISLTAKGRLFSLYLGARGSVVRRIKQNEKVWAMVKTARAKLRGQS